MGRSPIKEVSRARSPEKQIIPTGLSPAKSESQIANSVEKKRESRSLEHLNTAVENRARREEKCRRRKEIKCASCYDKSFAFRVGSETRSWARVTAYRCCGGTQKCLRTCRKKFSWDH